MEIRGMLTPDMLKRSGLIIPFPVLVKVGDTLIGKNIIRGKEIIGTITYVEVNRRNKQVYFEAQVDDKLIKDIGGGSMDRGREMYKNEAIEMDTGWGGGG